MEWSERIGRRIRLRDLHILLAVVQCKSMAKAAKQLAISKPVVSKVIADLEHVLGVRLLERDRHGVEPTVYGAALLKRGTAIFDELRESVKDIEFLTDPTAGEVRIACNPSLATSLVAAVVDRLSQRHPRITFRIVCGEMEAGLRALRERNVDFLMAWGFDPVADDRLGFEFLFEDRYVVVAGAKSPWARRRKIELAKLVKESWTLPPPTTVIGSVVREACRAKGLDYPRTIVVSTPEMRMALLATGRFLTVFPAYSVKFPTSHPDIKILPVELPMARRSVGIVTLKSRTLSPVAQLFIESARAVANPLAKQK